MKGVYANFQVLFFGLLGLLAIGGHHFNVEKYEILENHTSVATPISAVSAPEVTPDINIANTRRGAHHPVTAKVTSVTKSSAPVKITTAPDNISIGGRTIRIKSVSNTTVDAGRMVAKYGDKFLYGHNSSTVFGHLHTLGVGSTFTVTLGGQTTTYRIAKAVTLEKQTQVVPIMRPIANAQIYGQTYDLSIMTCAGTSYGNGDASHRLIIFANRL